MYEFGTKVTLFMLSDRESTKTGLRPRFYLNCSHMEDVKFLIKIVHSRCDPFINP